MMSAATVLGNYCRALSRLSVFLSAAHMHLALLFQPEWTGGLGFPAALAELQAGGVTALELNLPPALDPADGERWHAVIDHALPHFIVHLHAPLGPTAPGWPLVNQLLRRIAMEQSTPPFLVVHAPSSPTPTNDTAGLTRWLSALLRAFPPRAQLALEQGWSWRASMSPAARWRRWRRQAVQRRAVEGRPQGVGSGLGTVAAPAKERHREREVFDPQLTGARGAGYSAADTRAATLAAVEAVSDPRLSIAWDLANDWLGGPWSGTGGWMTLPEQSFLRRVGYVRLHDVAADGTDHLPLVVGHVPYTTQLRGLLRTRFDGPVCLAVRHGRAAARLGRRAELQATSLAVARHVLRING